MKYAIRLTDDQRWQSVLARDSNADGEFVFAVRTTGIFAVRLAEPDALRENVSFYANASEALAAGFRPANVVSQTKPIPCNIALIKLPTPADF